MKKLCYTLLFSFIFIGTATSQIGVRTPVSTVEIAFSNKIPVQIANKNSSLNSRLVTISSTSCHTPPLLSGLWQYDDLAFFCKIEVQLEKSVKLPVKFRLGSVQYVDYLEQK